MKVLGIDEAGRGPVIGPLIMCGFLIDERDGQKLVKLGVKDSKLMSPGQRAGMKTRLQAIAKDYALLKLEAKDIDRLRNTSNLNKIEIEKMAELINLLQPDKVIVDAIEANTQKFAAKLAAKITMAKKPQMVAENFADKNFPVVSAASVLAKLHRDDEMVKLSSMYGAKMGSGYPHDPDTIDFLKTWMKKNKEYPDCVRKSWITAITIKNNNQQKKLANFD